MKAVIHESEVWDTMSANPEAREMVRARARRTIRVWRRDVGRYLFVLPAALFIVAFLAYPLIDNILVSFHDVNINTFINGNAPFNGLANYRQVVQTADFQAAVSNIAIFAVCSLTFQFLIGMLLALFFNRSFPLSGTIRALILLPWLLPLVVTATAFKWLFTDPNGLMNYVFVDVLHVLPHHLAWLADSQLALPVAIVANIWIGIPFNMIILHSGLQGIPEEIYEASAIDGANRWVQFSRITLPLLRPVVSILFMLGLIYSIKIFDVVYVLTGGGPGNATEMLSILSYQLSFHDFQFGQGAAVGTIMVLVALIFAVIYLAILRREQSLT